MLFDEVQQTTDRLQGYSVEFLGFSLLEEAEAIHISLRWGPGKPDATLIFKSIYYFSISKFAASGVLLLDRIVARVLEPSDEEWPAGLPAHIRRSPKLPPLLWFATDGPVQINVLAAQATVLSEACEGPNEMD